MWLVSVGVSYFASPDIGEVAIFHFFNVDTDENLLG